MRSPAPEPKRRHRGLYRQYGVLLLILCLFFALGACEFGSGQTPEWLEQFEKPREAPKDAIAPRLLANLDNAFFGAVVADEPLATLAARNVLAAGGTAADAAVALYFSLAVTYPSAAGLGGGGICVVHDPENQQVVVLDFLKPLPARSDLEPGLVPGNVAGMAALHLRYRGKEWGDLLLPAEEYAKNGVRVSRALGQDLARDSTRLLADAEARHLFANFEGTILHEGDRLSQLELVSTLKHVRSLGPASFYQGAIAIKLVAASAAVGGALDHAALGGLRAAWQSPLATRFDEETLYTVDSTGGRVVLRMWEMLTQGDRYRKASTDDIPHLLAEVGMRAFAGADAKGGREDWMADYDPRSHLPVERLPFAPISYPDETATTGYVVVDRKGLAVLCAHTMNRPFGTGRAIPGTGILFAAPMAAGSDIALAPVLVMRHIGRTRLSEPDAKETGLLKMRKTDPLDYTEGTAPSYTETEPIFLAVPSGGAPSISALVQVAAETLLGGRSLAEALTAARVHHAGLPDAVAVEEKLSSEGQGGLLERNHRTKVVEALGRVNAVACREGVRLGPENCEIENEPRGSGAGLGTGR